MILVGVALILIRNLYARFIMSFLYRIPVLHKDETTNLQDDAAHYRALL